ncbi:MAG: sulfatase [Candidatus Coatesbacteria bacterium]|nr:MAG: sulfatase [Candidatus Coatesbacteria bacterium]
MSTGRKTWELIKRAAYAALTAAALGFTWGFVEAVTNRYWPAVGTYRNPYFLSSVNDRAIFYALVASIILVLTIVGVKAVSRVFRARADWNVAFTTGVFAVVFAGAAANIFFLFKSDMGVWHYFEVFANKLEPYLEDNLFPGYVIMTVTGTLLFPLLVTALKRPRWRRFFTAYAVFAAGAFAVCQAIEVGTAASRPVPAELPDVYVITIDACRADRFKPEVMPRLTEYARENCIIYENAYAPSSWTAPTFGSFATGQYPDVCMVGGMALGNAQPTLAEVMYENGYDTYFFTGNPVLDRPRGLHRGFEHHWLWSYSPLLVALRFYDTDMLNTLTRDINDLRPAGEVNRAITENALAVIEKDSTRPKFSWFHYMDPHWPYHPEPQYVKEEYRSYAEDAQFCFDFDNATEENLDIIEELYTAEVRALDDEVITLIDAIEHNPRPALIIFTSDHGEELNEHGLIGEHGKTIYQEVMLVPFFIKLPETDKASRTTVVSRPVNLLNLASTILDYVGFDAPASIQGWSLFSENAYEPPDGIILFGSWVQTDDYLYGAVFGDAKLILTEEETASGGADGEYYSLSDDPRETAPLPYDETAERLRESLIKWKAGNDALRKAQKEGIMPKPTEVDLKGLGYVD